MPVSVRFQDRLAQMMFVGLLSVVVSVIGGCGLKTNGLSVLKTRIGNFALTARFDDAASISSGTDSALVAFSSGKLTVDKLGVQLNGKELVKLPENAKKVNIDYSSGKLTITVDGKSLYQQE